jgi:hypothetical protein
VQYVNRAKGTVETVFGSRRWRLRHCRGDEAGRQPKHLAYAIRTAPVVPKRVREYAACAAIVYTCDLPEVARVKQGDTKID